MILLTVVAANGIEEIQWVRQLRDALGDEPGIEVRGLSQGAEAGQILFVDMQTPGLDEILAKTDRRGRAVFLLARDGAQVPRALHEGKVDDVLVHPFRRVEILSKLNHYRQLLMWDEISKLNASFKELIDGLRSDLQLAERLQKSKLPIRFPEVKGFKIGHRYLAGMRSGGDHFDLADANEAAQLSIVLSDSSSYGLSSAVLGVLMQVALKLSAQEVRSSYETVRRIRDELVATLSEKDRLSLFYGVISRRDYKLRYLNLGTACAYHASADAGFKELPSQSGPITKNAGFPSTPLEAEVLLQPQDRLALVSDGFVEAAGGPQAMRDLLDEYRKRESVDCLNELVYRVKSKFKEEDDMPEQDCTAVIFDVDARVIRLASG